MSAASALIYTAASAGVLVACYALYVEVMHGRDASFTAACDFGEHASCSAVLSSPYSHVLSFSGLVRAGSALDVPNAALGLVFYALALAHAALPRAAVLAAATGSLAFSAYLAYVLAFVLKDFCVVCVATYCVNALIFAGAAQRALAAPKREAAAPAAGGAARPARKAAKKAD